MSKKTGIPIGTLNKYVSLRSAPSALNALKIAQAIGMTLEDLAEGKTSPTAPRNSAVNPELIERLHDRVAVIYNDLGQKPPHRRIAREAANLYNELAKIVQDMGDAEMVEAALPMVTLEFKRRLERAAAEPGTGKRSA